MEGRIRCKCGNEITVTSETGAQDYSLKAKGGELEKAKGYFRVCCGKCGKEAGRINFYRQVEEKK